MAKQSVQTRYAGQLFRSRLEARWAAFFDLAEVEWEYEPKEDRQNGWWPDFAVKGQAGWVMAEVKPVRFSPRVLHQAFDKALGSKWSLLLGTGPRDGFIGCLARIQNGFAETVGISWSSDLGLHAAPLDVAVCAGPSVLWREAEQKLPQAGISAAVNKAIEAKMQKHLFHFGEYMPND